jgi:hypothetical protein
VIPEFSALCQISTHETRILTSISIQKVPVETPTNYLLCNPTCATVRYVVCKLGVPLLKTLQSASGLSIQNFPVEFVEYITETIQIPCPLVATRTTTTKRPPLVGEVSANFCWYRVSCGKRSGHPRQLISFSRLKPLLFLSSSSSIILTRMSGPRSRTIASQKMW